MPFHFEAARLYRMPVHFGPTPGPRQGPDLQPFDWSQQPDRTLWAMDFDAPADAVAAFLPPGFAIDGEPMIRLEFQQWRRLAWLAGRGYNTFGVKVPVVWSGERDTLRGHFLAVLWEDMPDAIVSGREELGYNKIFATFDEPREHAGRWEAAAHWFGHRFMEFSFEGLRGIPHDQIPAGPRDGILNLKYIPGTGEQAAPDASYVTLTPPGGQLRVTQLQAGTAQVRFLPTRWEDMPTQHHIVARLAAMGLGPARAAWRVESTGARDLADTRRVS